MQITKSGIFDLNSSKKLNDNITIKKGIDTWLIQISENYIFDRDICIENNSTLIYRQLILDWWDMNIKFNFNDDSKWNIFFILLSKDSKHINLNLDVNILWSNVKTEINILCFVWNNWKISAQWTIYVDNNLKDVRWDLLEESIYLANSGEISFIPKLNINSNEVKTSHWVKIHKLDENKIFYINSKWIEIDDAKNLMITWYFNKFFEWFDWYEDGIQDFIKYLIG